MTFYTGPTYDGKEVAIQLDNAIEVPNKDGVTVENACIQTFANDDGELQKINHIINGVGGSVSSGVMKDNPLVRGEGWSRKFLLFYNNGKAKYGKETNGLDSQRGKFIGLVACGLDDDDDGRIVDYDKPVEQPADAVIYTDRIEALYNLNKDRKQGGTPADVWKTFTDALAGAKELIEAGNAAKGQKYTQSEIADIQTQINIACTKLESAIMGLTGSPVDEEQVTEAIRPSATPTPMPSVSPTPSAAASATPTPGGSSGNSGNGGGGTIIYIPLPFDTPTPAPANTPTPTPSVTPEPTMTPEPTNTPKPAKVSAKKVTLNLTKAYVVKGKSIRLKGVMAPDETTDKLTWSSSKKSVAAVKNGKVTAKKTGTAKITVKTTSGKKAVCTVYVVKKAKKSTAISLNKRSATIERGSWIILKASLKPAKSTDTVKWKSSDSKVASVDAYGFVKAKGSGTATITATAASGKKAKCKVTVNNNQKIDVIISTIQDAVISPDFGGFLKDFLDALKKRAVPMKKAGNDMESGYADTGVKKNGYQLIWSDEFDGNYGSAVVDEKTGLNLENWDYQYGDGSTDCGNYGWGNQELECYTDDAKNIAVNEDVDDDGINDGLLRITAAYEEDGCKYGAEGKKDYSSARIRTTTPTEALFNMTYGYAEARIKLPATKGAGQNYMVL